jgi:transposase-like protein
MQHPLTAEHGVIMVLASALLAVLWRQYRPRLRRLWRHQVKPRLPRRWKPKSPGDCPHCRAGVHLECQPIPREVIPYSERKSSRGRRKTITTQGFACPCPDCYCFAVTDHKKHALVGNGKRGKNKNIQHLRCQWCLTDFSVRRGTPLYYIKTDPKRVEMVLWLLAEGVDISVMVRFSGHAEGRREFGSAELLRSLLCKLPSPLGWNELENTAPTCTIFSLLACNRL